MVSNTSASTYPIRTVASITGIRTVTLRAWENRYGLLAPQRTATGHRRYSDADIERLVRALELRSRGIPMRRIAQMLAHETNGNYDSEEQLQDYRQPMLAAIRQFDENALDSLYQEAQTKHSASGVVRQVLIPLLKAFGERWQRVRRGIAEEIFFRNYLRYKLNTHLLGGNRHATGPLLLAACLPEEQHDIGLLTFCFAAQLETYRIINLGASLPFNEIPTICSRKSIEAVVLSGSCNPRREVLTGLQHLVTRVGIPVLVGGPVSLHMNREVRATGAVPVGGNIDFGLRLITRQIECCAQRRLLQGRK